MNDEPELRMPQFRIIFLSDVTSFIPTHTRTHTQSHMCKTDEQVYVFNNPIGRVSFCLPPPAIYNILFDI